MLKKLIFITLFLATNLLAQQSHGQRAAFGLNVNGDDLEVEGISLAKGTRIIYNETGELNSMKPRKNVVINGIPCKGRKWLAFYSTGKIKWCTPAKDIEINSIIHKKGKQVNFDEDGKIIIQQKK